MDEIKNKNKSSYTSVIAFLTLEILAFLAFNLSNSIIVFGIFGLVLLLFVILTSFRQIKENGITNAAFFFFPLFIFLVLATFRFLPSVYFNGEDIEWGPVIFVPIAVLSFAISAYYLGLNKAFKIRTALTVIYSAIALYALINLISTMVEYVPFYTLKYKNAYVYYNGLISSLPIASMSYTLLGFSTIETKIEFFSFAPMILLSASVSLFFINPKKEKKTFILYSLITFIGFISLLLTPNKVMLLSEIVLLIVLAIVILFSKKKWHFNKFKILGYVIIILFTLLLLIFILNASFNFSFISNNSLLNRLFNANRFANKYNLILKDVFNGDGLYGAQLHVFYNGEFKELTGNFIIDALFASGVFGIIFFMVALILGLRHLFIYYDKGHDKANDKTQLLAFVLSVLVLMFVNYESVPLANSEYTVIPFMSSPYFILTIFLMSYAFKKAEDTMPKKEEEENK